MKKTIILIISLMSLQIVASCHKTSRGYDYTVDIPAEGGRTFIDVTENVYLLEITDYNGEGEVGVDNYVDENVAQYEWLTAVKSKISSPEIIHLTAEPNTTGKNRTLYVRGMVKNSFIEIKVTQSK